MNYRLILAGLAATGGLLATAVLHTGAANADNGANTGIGGTGGGGGIAIPTGGDTTVPDAPGADTFSLGGYTVDPYTAGDGGIVEGFDPVRSVAGIAPFAEIGSAAQDLNVYDSSGVLQGSISTDETVTNFLGTTNAQLTVLSSSTVGDGVPVVGSVYDSYNFGDGFQNVYAAVPGTAEGSYTTTDTLVTPFGDIDLNSLVSEITPALNPGDAVSGLEGLTSAGGSDAFLLGGLTFDPFAGRFGGGSEGYGSVTPVAGALPFFEVGTGEASFRNTGEQLFTLYDGSDSASTEIGTAGAIEDLTNIGGFASTQLTINEVDSGATLSDLPAVGTVYEVVNLGDGVENIYTATPGASGTVTDTLVTPFGNYDMTALVGGINAATGINPGAALVGLEATTSAGDDNAFAIGTTTFDPYTLGTDGAHVEGFATVFPTFGAGPLFSIAGEDYGRSDDSSLTQSFEVYDGTSATANDVGSITAHEDVARLFGFINTEFTVETDSVTTGLPPVGSMYDVFDFGAGIENVYAAGPTTITDTLVTPLGNVNLDSLAAALDAISQLDPGDAFTVAAATNPLAFLGL